METTAAPTPTDDHLDEVGAFFTTLLGVAPDAPTACPGWTAHELTAHLAAGAAEEAALIEAHLAGAPARETRSMTEREAPFRALPDDELRTRLVDEGARLTELLAVLAARGDRDGDAVEFTGKPMRATDFAMHSRSECALHRWDLVGSDEVSLELLARPALTVHAVGVLTEMVALPEAFAARAASAAGERTGRTVLRSLPADDVAVTVNEDGVSIRLEAPDAGHATIDLHPAHRLLLLWGRRPAGIDLALVDSDAGLRVLAGR
jgi:uncharacterized protein (TIGR03083 family)